MRTVKQSVHSGLKWMAISVAISRICQFLSSIILARLLTKEEFGLVIAAMTVIVILRALGQMGLGAAFIQSKKFQNSDEILAVNTLFTMTTAANVLLFSLVMLSVDQLAAWLPKVEGLEPVLRWLLTMLLLDSLASTATSLLRKRLEFTKVAQSEITYAFTYIPVAVLMAFLGYGVWGLVSGHIAARLLQAIHLLLTARWRPRFQFNASIALNIMEQGLFLWGFSALSTVGSVLDRAFIARLLGSVSMGIYGISHTLCTLPANQIAFLVNGISFPAMAQMQDDLKRLQNSFLKALSHVCLIAVPVSTGLFLVAEDLIPVVYGMKWEDAVPTIRILAFYGMVLAIASVTNPVLMAIGKAKQLLYTSIFHHLLLFIGLWLVGDRGVEQVAWMVLLTLTTGSVIAFMLVMHYVKLKASQILAPICRSGLAAAFMAVAVESAQIVLGASLSHMQMLMVSVALGAGSFAIASLMVNRHITLDVFRTLRSVASSQAR